MNTVTPIFEDWTIEAPAVPLRRVVRLRDDYERRLAALNAAPALPRLSVAQWAALDAWAAIRLAVIHPNTSRSLIRRGLASAEYRLTDAGRAALHEWKRKRKVVRGHAT